MSYSAWISFKTIEAEDIPEFFLSIKKDCSSKIEELAEDMYMWSPYDKRLVDPNLDRFDLFDKYKGLHEEVDLWIYRVFTFRWFYLKEYKLLGIYGLPTRVRDLCDCTVYFQNSCDQNYDYDEWKGIPLFESIVEKWKAIPDEYFAEDTDGSICDAEYYRQTAVYKEIWDMIEYTLEDDSSITYISLFGYWDSISYNFGIYVWKKYVENMKKWEKEAEEREIKNESQSI